LKKMHKEYKQFRALSEQELMVKDVLNAKLRRVILDQKDELKTLKTVVCLP